MKNTLYAILGVDDKATLEGILAAYQVRIKKLRYAGDLDSQNEMKLVRHAFEILSDPEQREKYDQKLKTEATLSNTIIYYSRETRHGSHGALKLIVVCALVIAGFMAYQHYFQKHGRAVRTDNMAASAELVSAPVIQAARAESVPTDVTILHPAKPSLPEANRQQPNVSGIDTAHVPNPTSQRQAFVEDVQTGRSGANNLLVLGRGREGNYFVDGSVNGHYLNFMVDTGASYVSLPMSFAIASGLHCDGLGTVQTGNGQSKVCHVVLKRLTFGNFNLQYVDALVAPNLSQPLLGMNVLKQFHVEQIGDQMRLIRVY